MFPYHGEISELSFALDAHRERMTDAYRKVLGAEFYAILEGADAKLLGKGSFQAVETIPWRTPDETTPGTNKFFMACESVGKQSPPKFSEDGHFKCAPLTAAPGFMFSVQGFENSRTRYKRWIDPYLAPYIHEYDHFVLFALQAKPMIVAMQVMAENFKIPRMPLRIEDIERIVLSYSPRRSDRMMAAQLLVWAYVIQEFYETSTRALDREIFLAMGLGVPQHYFKVPPKALIPFPMAEMGLLLAIPHGDMFFGKSIENRLETISLWTDQFRPSSEFQANFMVTFARLDIRKCSFGELSRDASR